MARRFISAVGRNIKSPLRVGNLVLSLHGRQGQARDAHENAAFLVRKHTPETRRIEDLLALIRRHLTKVPNRGLHPLLPLRRKLSKLRSQPAGVLLLLRCQVFPDLHPVEHALLLLRLQAVKTFQPVAEPLLLLRWQTAEGWIILQRSLLLLGRKIAVAAQPVSGMMLGRSWHFVRNGSTTPGSTVGLGRPWHWVGLRRVGLGICFAWRGAAAALVLLLLVLRRTRNLMPGRVILLLSPRRLGESQRRA